MTKIKVTSSDVSEFYFYLFVKFMLGYKEVRSAFTDKRIQ